MAEPPAPAPMSASATTASASSGTQQPPPVMMNDQLVIDYLKKKGLGMAALELEQQLQAAASNDGEAPTTQQRLQQEDALSRNQRSLVAKSTGSGYYGYDRDSAWPIVQWGVPDTTLTVGDQEVEDAASSKSTMGVEEARAYLDAFCSIQLWVLSLPDQGHGGSDAATRQVIPNPIRMAHQLIQADGTLEQVIEQLTSKQKEQQQSEIKQDDMAFYNLPPSCKPELMSICFALLVHTYCELLEVGMETTAHLLRDAFRPVYMTLYPNEFRDLDACTSVDDIVRLNSYNSQHMEAISALKTILVQVASYQSRRDELVATRGGSNEPQLDTKIQEYEKNIRLLKQKYGELSQRASVSFDKMLDLPFLRRARAVRWQLTLSTATYGMLCAFFNSKDESLLVMSTLLQTKCELHVEKRDPLPFTPACILMEGADGSALDLNKVEINWAAPSLLQGRDSAGQLPFPKFHLDSEYDDEIEAAIDKKRVEFNRALLTNGFRRLEAIERKREYESLPALVKKRLKENVGHPVPGNPLSPSILLMTLTASSSGPVPRSQGTLSTAPVMNVSTIWEESGIGLCCARASPPDGRRVAVGCDDAAVRIYNSMETDRLEPSEVLLGHRNGLPVFDLDWNRDGRTLLSAGGDGAVRLWDTMAVGPFGEVAEVSAPSKAVGSSITGGPSSQTIRGSTEKVDSTGIAGLKPEKSSYSSGTALAVYRGHVPNSPVWSVSFAPSGYYFASAGGDSSARLWVTDRATSPVRLFTGHTAANVNTVEWHPNCNYIITGSDDKTVRLWDIQSGRTVRLLDGCGAGINTVKISPNGQYAAGSDYSGVVHIWDLGMGKKVTELRSQLASPSQDNMMVHSLSFSPCGTALATGGDDMCVRIWDVRSETISHKPIFATPAQKYFTKKTMIMDLCFTKRNLLLSVGKVVTPVPIIIDE